MLVKITIDCPTANALLSHLNDIADTIRVISRGDLNNEFEVGTHFTYNTPYGNHDIEIIPEDQR